MRIRSRKKSDFRPTSKTIYLTILVTLFQDEDDNLLINELGIYILDKLSMFQNMQDYAGTASAATDIDNYVRECALLRVGDGTKIYRVLKELLAYNALH